MVKYNFSGFMPRQEKDKGELVVYLHRRATTGEPFYVGMGVVDRPSDFYGRNDHWKRIHKKHGCAIELLSENCSEVFVKKIEIWLIALFRSLVGKKRMANVSDGGEGGYGLTGEKSGSFRGFLRLYDDNMKIQVIVGGKKDMRNKGFNDKSISAVKNGEQKSVGSKFYADANGYRIPFKVAGPFATRSEAMIDSYAIAEKNATDAKTNWSKSRIVGTLHYNFKGYRFGVNQKTKRIVLAVGEKGTIAQGFNQGNVDKNIAGTRPHHKGFVFTRISDPEELINTIGNYLEQGYTFHHELSEQNYRALQPR
jgi:hypothetical protein